MYQVTKACTRGELRGCTCISRKLKYDRPIDTNNNERLKDDNMGKYEWGGCSENVIFGYKLSKIFVDSKEKEDDNNGRISQVEGKLINLHNNEVGRRVKKHIIITLH